MQLGRRAMLAALAAMLAAGGVHAARKGRGGGHHDSAGSGVVVSVDASTGSFVVQPDASGSAAVTITTDSSTQYENADGTAATFDDIVVGVQVAVHGTATDTDTVAATEVLIGATGHGSGRGGCEIAGSGTVTSVDATTGSFVVQPAASGAAAVTVTTDSTTQFALADGTTATFDDIVVGAEVAVHGTLSGTNTVAATEVLIGATSTGSAKSGSKGGSKSKKKGKK